MTDIITLIAFGLFILMLAPAFGLGVAIIFGHMLLKRKEDSERFRE